MRAAVDAMLPTARDKGVELVGRLRSHAVPTSTATRIASSRSSGTWWPTRSSSRLPAGEIEVIVGTVDDHVEIEVNDSGHGIAPEFLPHVFDAFRQADGSSTRAHSGLGLGLAIVKHIVELHHGSVDVTSGGYGCGARFVVRLPLLATEQEEPTTDWPSRSSGAFERVHELAGVHVLVVDDDDDSRDMLAMVFQRYGASVEQASSAAAAFAALKRRRPDLLVSDIGMPEEDGYSLIRRIRDADRATGAFLPAIALTGFATAEDGSRALASGFQLHIAKPIDPAELLMLVSSLLQGAPTELIESEQSGRRGETPRASSTLHGAASRR